MDRLPATLAFDPQSLAIALGVGIGMLVMIYFGIRYWIVSTRPTALKDIETPNIDRLNRKALDRLAHETLEEDEAETRALEDEEPPEDLKAIVQPTPPKPTK